MRRPHLSLQSFRLRNFKAVRDSGTVSFTPLTVFIGNNGSGKSSLIEGLETFQTIVTEGLDAAMNRWYGLENVWNKATPRHIRQLTNERPQLSHPLSFAMRGLFDPDPNIARGAFWRFEMDVSASPSLDEVFIARELMRHRIQDDGIVRRNSYGKAVVDALDFTGVSDWGEYAAGESMINYSSKEKVESWQFLSLNPLIMGLPQPQRRASSTAKMNRDGSNLGDYLLDILKREGGIEIFDDLITTLRYVLPYATDVQPTITSELQRTVYVQLSEANFKVPSWLLSTGTLRVLAILAVLRHPEPAPLVCIEEIENGLDPRTVRLVMDEIDRVTEAGRIQVICTTHSPYLLNLLSLSSIVITERDEIGQPIFFRPDEKVLGEWAERFTPGDLYTMSQLKRVKRRA